MTEPQTTEGAVERAAARGMVTGTIIGLVLVTGMFTGMMLFAGAEFVSAVGVGLFAGFWGGPGFGGMMGAILGATRAKETIAALEPSGFDAARPDSVASAGGPGEIPYASAA